MSHEAQTWALKIITGSPTRKAVLMYLANRANTEDGASWPSQGRVARETEFGERTIRDALKDLEELGIIRRITRQGTSDMIYLNMNWRPAGAAGVQNPEPPNVPAGAAAAVDSAAGNAGDDRQELPEVAAGDAGVYRQELPPNLQEEPSSNSQREPSKKPRKTSPWPEDYRAQFWSIYPKKPGDSRKEAWSKLDRIHKDDEVEFEDLMRGLRFYAARMAADISKDPTNRRFIAAAVVWLNKARWETEEAPGPQRSSRRQTMAI
jgi:hypothetical protein